MGLAGWARTGVHSGAENLPDVLLYMELQVSMYGSWLCRA